MSKDKDKKLYPLPTFDPVTGARLIVSELTSEESGITIRGRFQIPPVAMLPKEQSGFLESFLRNRGNLSAMEKDLNLSYPTLRSRLDDLLSALGMHSEEESPVKKEKGAEKLEEKRNKIFDQLERGEINADQAKSKLKSLTK